MAHSVGIRTDTLPSSGDLSASEFCAVVVNSSGQAALPASGVAVYGVLQNQPKALGRAAVVAIDGVTPMKLGASGIAAGTSLMTDSSGRGIAATGSNVVIGILKETGGGTNSIGSVELRP